MNNVLHAWKSRFIHLNVIKMKTTYDIKVRYCEKQNFFGTKHV